MQASSRENEFHGLVHIDSVHKQTSYWITPLSLNGSRGTIAQLRSASLRRRSQLNSHRKYPRWLNFREDIDSSCARKRGA
jgi:hypothetical protein